MRKFSKTTKTIAAAAIAGVMSAGALVLGTVPAEAQIHAGVGIGPVGVGVNLGNRGYYDRDGYWHDYRDRVVVHDYGYPDYYSYDTAYPYDHYARYDCGNPASPYFDTDFCD